ncbi:MAG: AraC family transcriptional regulator [Roseburia sp.]|nr:AraC family transcriptional regulator [Roseburia sp.]
MNKPFFEKYKTSEVTNTRSVINTPTAFTRENFFYIQEAGYLKSLKSHLSRRKGLDSYLFFVVLSGSGSVSYREPSSAGAMVTVPASTGDCFYLDCSGEYTHISTDEDPWELLWIHFYGPQSAAYYTYFREHHNWQFRSCHFTELIAAIENIIHYNEEPTDDTALLTAQQIVNILTLICTESDDRNELLSDKLKTILHYLDEHYTENISLDRLAEQFFISKYYLSREFKKEFGTTIIQYVLAKKISHAKELLRYSNASIEEIARMCGIEDASYFNKVFKKMEGCTASEYRRRW